MTTDIMNSLCICINVLILTHKYNNPVCFCMATIRLQLGLPLTVHSITFYVLFIMN